MTHFLTDDIILQIKTNLSLTPPATDLNTPFLIYVCFPLGIAHNSRQILQVTFPIIATMNLMKTPGSHTNANFTHKLCSFGELKTDVLKRTAIVIATQISPLICVSEWKRQGKASPRCFPPMRSLQQGPEMGCALESPGNLKR